MLNKVQIIGRLGQDPELKYLGNGTPVCNFPVATSEHWKDKDGNKQEKTEWHKIVVFQKAAENCSKYLSKGRLVYIEGKIQTRSWEKDGQKHYSTEIIANDVKFLSSSEQQKDKPAPKTEINPHEGLDYQPDDLPF